MNAQKDQVKEWPKAGRAVLRVRDNGRGTAPELLPRVFDPFWQGPGHGEKGARARTRPRPGEVLRRVARGQRRGPQRWPGHGRRVHRPPARLSSRRLIPGALPVQWNRALLQDGRKPVGSARAWSRSKHRTDMPGSACGVPASTAAVPMSSSIARSGRCDEWHVVLGRVFCHLAFHFGVGRVSQP